MTKEDRHIAAELSASTTAKMGKDGNVALEGLARIWTELGCRVEQVTEMTEVNREEGEHDE